MIIKHSVYIIIITVVSARIGFWCLSKIKKKKKLKQKIKYLHKLDNKEINKKKRELRNEN